MSGENNQNLDLTNDADELPEDIRPLQLYREGISLGERGKYDAAIKVYTRALEALPEFESIYMHRAMAYEAKEQYDQAIADMDAFIKHGHEDDKFNYIYRARLNRAKRDNNQALADYTEAIRLDPTAWKAYLERGEIEYELGKYVAAILDLTFAITQSPGLIRGLRVRGLAYMAQLNYDAAIQDYTQAISECESGRFHVIADDFYRRGHAFAQKGERVTALNDYRHALEIDPHHPQAAEMERYLSQGE